VRSWLRAHEGCADPPSMAVGALGRGSPCRHRWQRPWRHGIAVCISTGVKLGGHSPSWDTRRHVRFLRLSRTRSIRWRQAQAAEASRQRWDGESSRRGADRPGDTCVQETRRGGNRVISSYCPRTGHRWGCGTGKTKMRPEVACAREAGGAACCSRGLDRAMPGGDGMGRRPGVVSGGRRGEGEHGRVERAA